MRKSASCWECPAKSQVEVKWSLRPTDRFLKIFIFPGNVARPERVELPTFWFVAVAARRINKLHRMSPSDTNCY